MTIHHLDTIESTHQYCQLLDLARVGELTVFSATEQTAGVGQAGNRWEARPGMNLTFSFVLHPSFLKASHQYRLTETLSLAIARWLQGLLPHHRVWVKWPNDIYVDGHKICGTLNSVRVQGSMLAHSISSTGVNINQTCFPDWVPRPTSLCLLTGRQYNLDRCLEELMAETERCYSTLRHDGWESLHQEYLDKMLFLGQERAYRYRGQDVLGTIVGVNGFGHLQLRLCDGTLLSCGQKEVEYLF